MHLIQKKLAGKDIPATLPQSLIPPSVRSAGASPFGSTAPQAHQPEPVVDLFSFDEPATVSSPPASTFQPLKPQSTGAFSPAPSKPSVETDPFNTCKLSRLQITKINVVILNSQPFTAISSAMMTYILLHRRRFKINPPRLEI